MTDTVSPPSSSSSAWQKAKDIAAVVRGLWQRIPFRHVLAATILLFIVKEQYPFSNFPMYSEIDNESDVLYITDQADNVLPMEKLFGTSSSTQKKNFITALKAICNPKKIDTSDASLEDRAQAGAQLMEQLFPKLKRQNLEKLDNAANITGLRMYYKVFKLEDNNIVAKQPQLVAERPL